MENQYQKVVNVSYLVLSGLVAFLVLTALMKLVDVYDIESKLSAAEYIVRGLSILIGVVLFVCLYRNQKVNSFMNEVVLELLTKVSWPTSKDTVSATIVVLITVVIAGIVLALLDWLWVIALRWII